MCGCCEEMVTSTEGEAVMDFILEFLVPLVACCGIGLVSAEFVACWIESYGEDNL